MERKIMYFCRIILKKNLFKSVKIFCFVAYLLFSKII